MPSASVMRRISFGSSSNCTDQPCLPPTGSMCSGFASVAELITPGCAGTITSSNAKPVISLPEPGIARSSASGSACAKGRVALASGTGRAVPPLTADAANSTSVPPPGAELTTGTSPETLCDRSRARSYTCPPTLTARSVFETNVADAPET